MQLPGTGTALRLLFALAMVVAILVAPNAAQAQSGGFPSVGDDFEDDGPYSVETDRGSSHTYYYPSDLGDDGLVHPVILWGNGTGASVSTYASLLRHFASHGFIVAAANTSSAGSGSAMLDGLDNLEDFNEQQSSDFYGAVDLDRVGTTGHSQGGGGAIAAARDNRVATTFPIQPWLGNPSGVDGSAFYMAGQLDTIVRPSTVERDFSQSSGIPAAYGELRGASHFEPVLDGGDFRGAATAWARWQLLDDQIARDEFVGSDCGLCTSFAWNEYETNALLD